MFRKILIANRGEIAVRIIRTCRDLKIATVGLYTSQDQDSLHVRLADEVRRVHSPLRYGDAGEVLAIAKATGCDAIHPGYGFLAEEADFVQRCADEGIAFIGPPAAIVRALKSKLDAMATVRAAGYHVPHFVALPEGELGEHELHAYARELGYPLVVKSARGGRGRGARVVMKPDRLLDAVHAARYEAEMIYGDGHLYFERVVAPSHYVAVQIMADGHGNMVHLGEREGSLLRHNQRLNAESPAPFLSASQRQALWSTAMEIARLFQFENVGSVEFLIDGAGKFYFTEIKARIQIEHPVSEMLADLDIVEQQIRIAAGERLAMSQDNIHLVGHAMVFRINAEDPWNDYLPSPGRLVRFRLPQGPGVRVDTYGYVGCQIPIRYDSLLAKVVVWDDNREKCLNRAYRALQEFRVIGVQTNLPLHLRVLADGNFAGGTYDTSFMQRFHFASAPVDKETERDMVAMVAVAFVLRNRLGKAIVPERLLSGWHRASRELSA